MHRYRKRSVTTDLLPPPPPTHTDISSRRILMSCGLFACKYFLVGVNNFLSLLLKWTKYTGGFLWSNKPFSGTKLVYPHILVGDEDKTRLISTLSWWKYYQNTSDLLKEYVDESGLHGAVLKVRTEMHMGGQKVFTVKHIALYIVYCAILFVAHPYLLFSIV